MTRVLHLNRTRSLLAAAVVFIFAIFYVFEHIYDTCGGKVFTEALCEQFEGGTADGTLCADLCRRKTLKLRSCIYNSNGYRLFHYGDYYLKVLESRFESYPLKLDNIFAKPSVGVDVQEFREMVIQFLNIKLGFSKHTELLEDLMNTADINRDYRVSLAEAKSLWALLKHNEFFMLTMLRHIQHLPAVGGFCGDMYAIQKVNHTPLYVRPSGGWWGSITTVFHQWGQPTWTKRGKVAVGLLEFISEIYHHRNNGMVYICDASENAFGYTDNHDMMVVNLNSLRPRHELELLFEKHQCASDSDCIYQNDCVLRCDVEQKTCSADLVSPNLYRICQLLTEYLRPSIPRIIRAELNLLFDRCNNLNATSPQYEMNHMLISNDLRSLLWRYVSDYVS